MTDYTDIQKAAEYAAQDTIKFADEAEEMRALQQFHEEVYPETVLALIIENERLNKECKQLILLEHNGGTVEAATNLLAERDQLKAENFQLDAQVDTLTEWYLNALKDAAAIGKDCDQVKAENEALRDDIEQSQYDANAWRNGEESVWIEVFNSEGDDPFISAISGQITVEQLALIQEEILEYREDYFEKGSGLYVFRCGHCQAHYDNVGMTEPAHWETDFESYSPFPWEEEAAAMANGEQS